MITNRTKYLQQLSFRLFIAGVLFSFSLLMASCTDHRIPPEMQRFRLKKTVATNIQGSITTILDYNAEGKLISFVGGDQAYNVQYDALGRFINVHLKEYPDAIIRRFGYDNANNVNYIQNNFYRGEAGLEILSEMTLKYSGTQYPASSSLDDSPSPRVLLSYYTFDSGNLIKLESEINYPSQNEVLSPINYQYDDKPNPYFGLLPLGISIEESLNKNNAIMSSNELIYNNNGMLIQKNINSTGPVGTRTTITFEYEVY